ncbi:MAG: CocE/NonD family hydrolase, partial [Chloroflexi bacterium]|nr:CocE/NonD family hydrolase [Chloroflexota bacterium]
VTPYDPHFGGGDTPPVPPNRGPASPTAEGLEALGAFERGYTIVIIDLPSFGASGGCWENFGPEEQEDVKAAVEWTAGRPWSNGRVGMFGMSASSLATVMALASRPAGLAAAAFAAPPVDLYRTVFEHGVRRLAAHAIGPFYVALGFFPGGLYDDPAYHRAYAENLGEECLGGVLGLVDEVSQDDPESPYWRSRDRTGAAEDAGVPILVAQGFLDYNVPAPQTLDFFARYRGPKRLWVGQWAHDDPRRDVDVIGRAGYLDEFWRLMEGALEGRVTPPEPHTVIVQEADGRWRGEESWPPADAEPLTLELLPGSYLDVPDNFAGDDVNADLGADLPTSLVPLEGRGSWTFSEPLVDEIHLSGEPVVTLETSGRSPSKVVVLLYDVSADGSAFLVSRGASKLGPAGAAGFALSPQDWRLLPGHRIGVLVTGADDSYYDPTDVSLRPVTVEGGELSLPALTSPRSSFVEGERGARFDQIKKPIVIPAAMIADREA